MPAPLMAAAALVSIAGGVMNLIGAAQGPGEVSPELRNPEQVAALMQKVNDAIARARAGQEISLQEIQGYQGELGQIGNQMEQIRNQQANLNVPGQNEAYETFLQRIPEYNAIAQQVAQEATSPYLDQREVANQRAAEAARIAQSVGAAQGNLYSGATAQAAAGAAGQALSAYEQQLAQGYQTAYQGTAIPLIQQGQGLARQDVQTQFQNEYAKLQGQLQALQQEGSVVGQQQQASLGQASLFQDSLNQQQSMQAQLMAPQFSTPTFVTNNMSNVGNALTGLGSGIGSFANINAASGYNQPTGNKQAPVQQGNFQMGGANALTPYNPKGQTWDEWMKLNFGSY